VYEYSLKQEKIEEYLAGGGFDNPEPYSPSQVTELKADINKLFQDILAKNPTKDKLAVITAGAPGSGKTYLLRQLGAGSADAPAYVCPDDTCLPNLRIYTNAIEQCDGSSDARLKAYNLGRPASNAATQILIGNLVRDKYAIYFGTAASSPFTKYFFEFLGKQNYPIELIHVTAPDDVRFQSINERNETLIQVTEKDVKEKGLLVIERIEDTYFKYASVIKFYYRGGAKENAKLSAIWTKSTEDISKGTLEIVDRDCYKKIKKVHNTAVKNLNKPELSWKNTVKAHSKTAQLV
jgi:dephospho-CoA kinase